MAKRKLGIHLAPYVVKLVETEEQAKNVVVLNYSIDYFPPEARAESYAKTLIASLKNNKIHTREVDLVISDADIIYKVVELPEMSEKEAASAIKYKLKALLPPSFKEIVFDYYKIQKSPHPPKHLFFVAVAPREKILEAIKLMGAAGLSIKSIIAPSSALRNVLTASVLEPCALVYLGKYSSLIVLMKEEQVVFAREVKIGGDNITQAMVGVVQTEGGRLELDYQRAEEIKNKYGIPIDFEKYSSEAGVPAPELLALMRPALEKIGAEILSTFDYYREQTGDAAEFKKIYFSGGASQTKNLAVYLRGQSELEIEPLPVSTTSVKPEFAQKAPSLTLALGAAIAGKDRLNLLAEKKEKILYATWVLKEARKWSKFIFLGIGILLVLALVFGRYYRQQKGLQATHKALQKEYRQQTEKMGKGIKTDLIKYSQRDRFALIMFELDKITPAGIYFENLKYNNSNDELVMKGLVLANGGKKSIAKFIEKLDKSGYFESVVLVYLQESDKYTISTYDFELKCLLSKESKK